MELHAFERMAQYKEVDSVCTDGMSCDGCTQYEKVNACEADLLPQPMTAFPDETPPAMAYVPYQMWGGIYEAEKGFTQGTMFPVLDQPFHCAEGGCCK